MEYRIEYTEQNGKKDRLYFVFDDKLSLLTSFLDDEVSHFYESMLADFDLVLSGKRRRYECSGNAFAWTIGPKTTKIVDMFPYSESDGEPVVVGTEELVQLMKEWNAARKEFAEKKKNGEL